MYEIAFIFIQNIVFIHRMDSVSIQSIQGFSTDSPCICNRQILDTYKVNVGWICAAK